MNTFLYKILSRHVTRDLTGFAEHLQIVTTNNYDSLTELQTPNTTETMAHIKPSQFSLAVAW
jgi:hypothetical protein